MELNNTTAMYLCYTLTELGFIQCDNHRRYRPTPKLLTLGYAFILCSGQGIGLKGVHRKTEIHTKGEVEMDNWLKGKTAIIIGERDGVQGPSIAKCLEAAGANVVYAVTECFV
jgi:betaine reductase